MRSRNHFRILQKKRYEARRFQNPYFQRKPTSRWKIIVPSVAAFLAVVCVVAFVFGSAHFATWNISVGGTETIPSQEIEARAWEELNRPRLLFFKSSNRFLYDEQRLRDALSSAYAFETLKIDRTCEWVSGGCVLSIVVKEKTSQLLWISGDRVYLADLQGVVIRELTAAETESWNAPEPPPSEPLPDGTVVPVPPPDPLKRLPAFVDVNDTPVVVGSVVLRPDEVANLFLFQKGLTAMGIGYAQTKIDRLAGKWMAVRTTVGYDIFVDAVGDVELQLTNLQALLRDTLKDTTGLQYIDLRFGDHVYYK